MIMKKNFLLFLLMICFVAGSLQAQFRKVPSAVTDSLKAKFPNAQKVEWKDKVTYFQAAFVSDGFEMTADFSSKGIWQETDKKISFDQLPSTVKDGFKKSKYNDWTPGSVTQIDKNDKSVRYRLYVEKSSLVQKKFLYFNGEGQLTKEEQSL
jgi:hypothetical protein